MEKEPEILEMLIRHELTLKQLYELFAEVFPHRQEFWQHIAEDEQRHSDWLASLRSEEALGNWFLSDSRFRPQAINSSISYVEMQIARARKGDFSQLAALSISKDLENALLEKQFSKIDYSLPAKVRTILMNIAAETEQHRKVIADALEAERH